MPEPPHQPAGGGGDKGVALPAQQGRPSAVVSDIGLARMNGWELAGRLRAALGAQVLLVALTGHCRGEDRRRSAEAGFGAHLSKPLEPAALLRLLGSGPAADADP